jgi:L-alanine-DL-glutamate epimerase-like enolase superfamily enzyme
VAVTNAVPDSRSGGSIAAVEAFTATFPLARPVQIGGMLIAGREFVFVTVTTVDGHQGSAFALSRGLPVGQVVRGNLAPLLVGADGDAIEACVDRCMRATPAPAWPGIWMRAMSLVEIALWDARGKRLGSPVWRLLGGHDRDVPVQLVADYLTEGGDARAVGERVGELSHEGYAIIKIARTPSPDLTRELLRSSHHSLAEGTRLVVDAAWCWRTVDEARLELEAWDCEGLAWLEDPFEPGAAVACARLRRETGLRLGVGDEVTDMHVLLRLLAVDAVDVLRADATSLGGISALRTICAHAAAHGVPVSFHAYGEVHLHCAAAWPGNLGVEIFEPDSAVYPIAQFVHDRPRVTAGRMFAPEVPGLGLSLDWERIHHHNVEREA